MILKFNGSEEKEYKTYKEEIVTRLPDPARTARLPDPDRDQMLTRLPPYLILCIKRFTKNTFFVEKSPAIINFPIKVTVMMKDVAGSVSVCR